MSADQLMISRHIVHILILLPMLLVLLAPATLGQRVRDGAEVFGRLTCTADPTCYDKYFVKWKVEFVCCVTVSCSDDYFYYDLSSGCASKRHCKTKTAYNADTSHFAARMSYSFWERIHQEATESKITLGALTDSRCSRTRELVAEVQANPDAPIRAPVDAIAFTPSCTACDYEHCCTRVVCGTRAKTKVPFEVKNECQEKKCTLRQGTKSRDPENPDRAVFWFKPDDYLNGFAWVKGDGSKYFDGPKSFGQSCETTLVYFTDLLRAERRRSTNA